MAKREQNEDVAVATWLRRVVGIAVLALASLMLWPFFSDEGPAQMLDTARQIPPAPEVEKYDVAAPVPVATSPVEPVRVDEDKPAAPAQGKADDKVTASAALTSQGLPQSWVVQVGSFGNQANADALKQKLRQAGYPAFTKAAADGKAVRVFVGPKLSRERADTIKAELEQKQGLKAFVTQFGQ